MKSHRKASTTTLVFAMMLSASFIGSAATPEHSPAPLDLKKAETEVEQRYAKAHPEIKEFILHTARSFGRSGLWFNEDAFATSPADAREKRVQHLATLFADGEYGRHLC